MKKKLKIGHGHALKGGKKEYRSWNVTWFSIIKRALCEKLEVFQN